MELTTKQHETVVKMAKAGKFFPEIAERLKIETYHLYKIYPGGVRVLAGKKAYRSRTAPTQKAAKVKKVAVKKRKAKKSEW
jgi:hypothetical protein